MNEADSQAVKDPYAFMFPLGGIIGLIAAGLWVAFNNRWISFYPKNMHANLMYFGMFWAFIAGFLMTAIPRMTAAKFASHFEVGLASFFAFLQVILNLRNLAFASTVLFAVQNIFLLRFILVRFFTTRRVPFAGFVFIPAAFVQLFLGLGVFFLTSNYENGIVLLGSEAFLMNLILGVGSRLIPLISRMPGDTTLPQVPTTSTPTRWGPSLVTLAFLNTGYLLQVADYKAIGSFLCTAGILIGLIFLLKIFVRPLDWSVSGIGLKLGAFFLLFGQAVGHPYFEMEIAAKHLAYIGGFGLITILIASRVMLSHGGQNLAYEIKSPRLILIVCLIASSALFRLFSGNEVSSWMIPVAATLFCLSLVLWLHKFLKIHLPS